VIVAWNQAAHDIAFAEDQFLTFKGQRALAIMHLAMHDALNSIVPLYSRYAYTGRSNAAHPVTAVAQAAHDVLVSLHPGQQARLASELAAWVGPGGPPRDRASSSAARPRKRRLRGGPATAGISRERMSFAAERASTRPRRNFNATAQVQRLVPGFSLNLGVSHAPGGK
jgi:hypothetical protein